MLVLERYQNVPDKASGTVIRIPKCTTRLASPRAWSTWVLTCVLLLFYEIAATRLLLGLSALP